MRILTNWMAVMTHRERISVFACMLMTGVLLVLLLFSTTSGAGGDYLYVRGIKVVDADGDVRATINERGIELIGGDLALSPERKGDVRFVLTHHNIQFQRGHQVITYLNTDRGAWTWVEPQ